MSQVPININNRQLQQYFLLQRLLLLILVYKRLEELAHQTSSSSTIASFAYTHDNVGNRLTKALDTGTKYTYSYDSIYRLTEALSSTPGYSSNTNGKGSGIATATQQQKEFYTYDPVGNRLSSDKYSSYTYNQANQLQTNGGIYSYDKNGNLTTKIEGTTVFSYYYDYENRLVKVVKVENGSTTTAEYKYDLFGRRIEKKVTESGTATTTRFVYDNEDIILEYDGSGTIGNRYVHGPGIDEPLAVITGKNSYYYHADGLGSIVALTDSTGKVQQTYEYDSFGNLKDQKNKVKQPYTFTGREWDRETGLYHNRVRNWDPKTGRWLQFDPILHPANGPPKIKSCSQGGHPPFNEIMKQPQKLNPYVYIENRPTILTDPSGLSAVITPGNSGWNGNYNPGYEDQDNVCSDPASSLNSNPCYKQCCKAHDDCYKKYGCNWSSWIGNYFTGLGGACQMCNMQAQNCILKNYISGN